MQEFVQITFYLSFQNESTNMMKYISAILLSALFFGCQSDKLNSTHKMNQQDYELGVVGSFSEMVAADVKQLKLIINSLL